MQRRDDESFVREQAGHVLLLLFLVEGGTAGFVGSKGTDEGSDSVSELPWGGAVGLACGLRRASISESDSVSDPSGGGCSASVRVPLMEFLVGLLTDGGGENCAALGEDGASSIECRS
jgi:hypothetical protein